MSSTENHTACRVCTLGSQLGAWVMPFAFVVAAGGAVSGCAEAPTGIRATPEGKGPTVVFNLTATPIPDLPLPNDIATRPDPSSPTGLRINASLLATTDFEATLREKLDRVSGWGTSQPVTLSFDAPIDIASLLKGHRDWQTNPDGRDYDFTNDVMFLVDVTPGSPTYQQFTPLDFGDGNFPDTLRRPDLYFEGDPNVTSTTLLNEAFDEDKNGNGRLDPGEDIDMDGHLDKPNVYPMLDGNPEVSLYDDIMTFYDASTDTLSARPLVPLLQKTTYAVVVTERLKGEDGSPVRSPFPFVNHTDQSEAIAPAIEALAGVGVGVDEIAFAWSFTTQDVHHEMVMIRDGLYGAGPMAWLNEDFEPVLTELYISRDPLDADTGEPVTNGYIIPGELLESLVSPLATVLFGATDPKPMADTHRFPAYHVQGAFETPYFLDMPGEERWNGVWPADLTAPDVRERVGHRKVNFWCSIPRWQYKQFAEMGATEIEARAASAPVAVIAHGYGLNRLTHLGGYSSSYAKFGVAGCEIDSADHGLELDDALKTQLKFLMAARGLSPTADILEDGRARDIDGDGAVDSGDTWFGADGYRIRDSFRQTALDYMVMIRVFRNFDGQRTMPWDVDGDGQNELAGDFDGDGNVDLGGAVDYFASGESLGGITSSILAGIEPEIVAAAPISGGAGLTTLALKTEQAGAFEPFSLQVMGPAWIGERDAATGMVRIYQLYANGNDAERTTVAMVEQDKVRVGDIVMVTNLEKRVSHCARVLSSDDIPPAARAELAGLDPSVLVNPDFFERLEGSFRVALPADRGDRVRIDIIEGSATQDVVDVDPDSLECLSRGTQARVRRSIDTWEAEASYKAGAYSERKDYAVGDPLVSLEQGIGFKRAHHLARQAINLVGVSIEPGDPVNYAPYYAKYGLEYREGERTFTAKPRNVLDIVTIGDPAVPVSLGVHIARAAGFIELFEPDSRWGKTPNRVITESHVLEAVPWLNRFPGFEGQLMDVDNYSESQNTATPASKDLSLDGFDSPRLDPPLRNWGPTPGGQGISGLSLPMPEAEGQHVWVVGTHSQTAVFDVGMYMANMVAFYFHTRGGEIRTEPCMEQLDDCDWLPKALAFPGEACVVGADCTSGECVSDECVTPSY